MNEFNGSTILQCIQANEEYAGWLFPSNPSSSCPTSRPSSDGNAIDRVRYIPEIMIQIYSYLPIVDRISTLAQVDTTFAQDTIRGGILCGTYGGLYSLPEALDKLEEHNNSNMMTSSNNNNNNSQHGSVSPRDSGHYRGTSASSSSSSRSSSSVAAAVADKKRRSKEEIRISRANKILQMKRRAQLSTSLYESFDDIERRRTKPHWLVDIWAMREALARFHWDGTFNRLSQLIVEEGYETGWDDYVHARQQTSVAVPTSSSGQQQQPQQRRMYGGGARQRPLPRLDPGCRLLLPDSDVGMMEHIFVTCTVCNKVSWRNQCHIIVHPPRSTGHGYCCYACDNKQTQNLATATACSGGMDTTTTPAAVAATAANNNTVANNNNDDGEDT